MHKKVISMLCGGGGLNSGGTDGRTRTTQSGLINSPPFPFLSLVGFSKIFFCFLKTYLTSLFGDIIPTYNNRLYLGKFLPEHNVFGHPLPGAV